MALLQLSKGKYLTRIHGALPVKRGGSGAGMYLSYGMAISAPVKMWYEVHGFCVNGCFEVVVFLNVNTV
ncbi:hypothetical protein SAMN02927921_02279 [Sinomicrobium oceani]|uniref:Uncharacterized protein n=1 Tax=Sinomicrobium oceani TaxID=1150368 RepID=A0A1K1Q5G9_9FLAO|nr:hypothetical protein [Sinomicrobium oceani]SFW54996.1 hypothetical protein SAMN02927921_02279 [Sinomicrobium oceani]